MTTKENIKQLRAICNYPCPNQDEHHTPPPYDKCSLPSEPPGGEPMVDRYDKLRQQYQCQKSTPGPSCTCNKPITDQEIYDSKCPSKPPPSGSLAQQKKRACQQSSGNRKQVTFQEPEQETCPKPTPQREDIQYDSDDPGPYKPGQIVNQVEPTTLSAPYGDVNVCPCPGGGKAKDVLQNKGGGRENTSPGDNKQFADSNQCSGNDGKVCVCMSEETRRKQLRSMGGESTQKTDGRPPSYLPQETDNLEIEEKKMGPIGPWATGKVDWAPLAGLTGTRPVVDKYTINRFSEGEWRYRNNKILTKIENAVQHSYVMQNDGRQCIANTRADIDKNQEDSTTRLRNRSLEVLRWKCELERALNAMGDEVDELETQRARLKQAGAVLTYPENIVGEALMLRTSRIESELVRDEVEEELMKEYSLIKEIRDLFQRTLEDINHQMMEDRTAKQRLEFDWGDKKAGLEFDAFNVAINNRSNVIMFKPGAASFMENQSTIEHWEHFTRETLAAGEKTRQRSAALRATLDAILINSARDLRSQADRVEAALTRKINSTDELRDALETKLLKMLKEIAEQENLAANLTTLLHQLDYAMKVCQTRLDNRNLRDRVENCRDAAQYGLLDEVKLIGEKVASVTAQLNQTNTARNDLVDKRQEIEQTIMMLRRTLEIDRSRIGKLRSFYPSTAALIGQA